MAEQTRAKKPSDHPPYIDRGEPLPPSCAENRIVALVRSPEEIYLYWDVETGVRVAGSRLAVRVHDLSARRAYDLEPPSDADNWYLRVAPNRTCRFELFEKTGAQLRRLASSGEVTTPIRWAGESGECIPAEIVQAAVHPISRRFRAPARSAAVALRAHHAEVAAAKAWREAARAWRAPAGATGPSPFAQPGAAQESAPAAAWPAAGSAPESGPEWRASPPPAPIPVPSEKVFAGGYAGLPGGSQGGKK